MKPFLSVLGAIVWSFSASAGDLPNPTTCLSAPGLYQQGFTVVNNGTTDHVTVTDVSAVTALAKKLGVTKPDDLTTFKSVEFDIVADDVFGVSPDAQLVSSWPRTKEIVFVKGDGSGSVPIAVGGIGKFQVERLVRTNVYRSYSTLEVTVGFRVSDSVGSSRVKFEVALSSVANGCGT